MDGTTKTRKAWRVKCRGKPEKVLELEVIDLPKLKINEVLVKVQAAALNPVDYKLMEWLPNLVVARPHIAAADFAGIVADANGSGFKEGEAVFGWNQLTFRKPCEGALAEFVKVSENCIVRTPNKLLATEVAGISLAGLTAYQALIKMADLQKDQFVFINGGSSSVGRFAIQIAKARGCRVVASCSTSKIEGIEALGAEKVFDYTMAPLHLQLLESKHSPKFNVFFDTIGLPDGDLFTNSSHYLAHNGIFISVGPHGHSLFDYRPIVTIIRSFLQPTWLGGTPRKFRIVSVRPNQNDLENLMQLLADGKLKCPVDSTYPFKDVLKAFDRLQTGRANGKVVVTVP